MTDFDFARIVRWNRKQLLLALLSLDFAEVRKRRNRIRQLRYIDRLAGRRSRG